MMLTALAVYVLAQLAISVWAARKTKSATDYLVAGRSLGSVSIGISVFATWFAVEGIVATSGAVASEGIPGALFDPIGLGVGILLFGILVAGPIRQGKHVMLSGFLGARFGGITEELAGVIVCMSAIIWSSVQLLALGLLLESLTDLSLTSALAIATFLVLAYTLLGGLLGDVITDVVQGFVLVLGLAITLGLLIEVAGGLETVVAGISLEQVFPPDQNALTGFETLFAALAASVAGTELAGRTLGARSPRVARNGAIFGGLLYLAVGIMPVSFGLIGPQLGVELPTGDGYLPAMIEALLPTWLRIILTGALLSAIFSTIDSALLAVSAVATQTGYRRLRPDADPEECLMAARVATVIAGLVAFAIAASGESIRALAIQSASVGGCILVPLLLGVLTGSKGRWGAPVSIITGFVLLLILEWILEVAGAFVLAILGALLAYGAAEMLRNRIAPSTRSASS